MSRTTPKTQRVQSPVKYYIRFNGETGTFSFYDKVKEAEVTLNELEFIVIDTRSSIIGWNDERKSRVFSNYVRTMKENMIVKCGNEELMNGLYADIKEKIAAAGGKFCTNVFALAQIEGDWSLVNIQFSGASLRDWSEYVSSETMTKIYGYMITAKRGQEQKKGRVTYYTPMFEHTTISGDLSNKADEYDSDLLQPYLNQDARMQSEPVTV